MSATEREVTLRKESRALRDFYASQGGVRPVSLFAEDFDWLQKRGSLNSYNETHYLDGIEVKRGPRKRKPRKKRPPEMFAA